MQTNEDEIDLPDVRMMLVHVGRSNKLWATARVLSHLEEDGQAIIFANTKRMVDLLVTRLEKAKFDVDGLHGDLHKTSVNASSVASVRVRCASSSPRTSPPAASTWTR